MHHDFCRHFITSRHIRTVYNSHPQPTNQPTNQPPTRPASHRRWRRRRLFSFSFFFTTDAAFREILLFALTTDWWIGICSDFENSSTNQMIISGLFYRSLYVPTMNNPSPTKPAYAAILPYGMIRAFLLSISYCRIALNSLLELLTDRAFPKITHTR